MTFSLPSLAKAWWLMLVAVTGIAQAQADKGPVSNTASAVGLTYRSVLENYQPYSAQQVQPWRESNDNVGRIGGWRAYAKETGQTDDEKPTEAEAGTRAGHPADKP